MKRLLLILFILSFTGKIFASEESKHLFHIRYTHQEGLPISNITSCCQDDYDRLWVGTNAGVYYYSGSEFLPFKDTLYLRTCNPITTAVVCDKSNCIWISTRDGVGYYDAYKDQFYELQQLKNCTINDIDVTEDGNVWLTASDGLWKYTKQDGALVKVYDSDSISPFQSCVVKANNLAFTANNNCIYIYNTSLDNFKIVQVDNYITDARYVEYMGGDSVMVSSGTKTVCTVDLVTGSSKLIAGPSIIENQAEVFSLLYREGACWIGTAYGIVIYNTLTSSIERQFPDELDDNSIGGESIRCLLNDNIGNVWAGTYNGGLRCWASYENGFKRFVSDKSPNSIIGNSIRSLCNGNNGQIYIGSEEGYICRYNPKTGIFKDITTQSHIAYGTAITSILCVNHTVWVATYGNGICTLNANDDSFINHYDLESNDCLSIYKTHDGVIYVGTANGLFSYDSTSDAFKRVSVVDNRFIHCMIEDEPGRLLLGLFDKGFGILDINKGTFRTENLYPKINILSSFYKDSQGAVWIATASYGLFRVVLASSIEGGTVKSSQVLNTESGMPTNLIRDMLEDSEGTLWVSTSEGLVEVDTRLLSVRKTYLQNDNVLGSQFTYCEGLIDDDGMLYMGNSNGMLAFKPEYLKEKFRNKKIKITNIGLLTDIDNRSIQHQEGRSVLNSESIKIRKKDAAYLSVSFSSMEYGSPNKLTYDCTLSSTGFKNSFTTTDNSFAFTNLNAGRYTFLVNYSGSDDPLTAAEMELVIVAPWYLSRVAIILYASVFLGLLWVFLYLRNKRKDQELQRKNELLAIKKEKAATHEKMDFLTNIAHEIRTPISVIQILLDKIMSNSQTSKSLSGELESMKLNVDNLNHLCNEVLDFRKIDSGHSTLVFADEDIQPTCLKVVRSFETAAKNKGIELLTEIPENPIVVHCDNTAVESVLCNLLSNAIKYCNKTIKFAVTQNEDKVVMRMTNDGERISDENKDVIFDAFCQLNGNKRAGSGLGLTYSRKIAEIHGGLLFVDIEDTQATTFVFEIPIQTSKVIPIDHDEHNNEHNNDNEVLLSDDKPCVLVVEDNKYMRDLIKNELSIDYNVLDAVDGVDALVIVKNGKVDLVVSDIMMPNMDGCQLCNAIKEDMELSHIPVLLLTAAVGIETHIRSLKSNADAYIEKPFKMDVLKENINALFRNRDIRNKQFSSSPLSHFSLGTISKVEQDFISRLYGYIIDHITETELTIETLANVMNVSKPTLARKIKATTGLTVNEYVRLCRLKLAAKMLSQNKYRINEVAYLVGYSSSSYFASCFYKQFNKLPSDFIKQ